MNLCHFPEHQKPNLYFFREWTQKALEEEQKKRDEEKRKRDEEREKKKQLQLQQQQQQQLNLKQAEVGGNVNATGGTVNVAGSPRPQQTPVPVRLKKNFASTVIIHSKLKVQCDQIFRICSFWAIFKR